MAEKKRQYSRALAQKRCLEAIERAILINKSEAERPFVFQVQELVVFGPLVDTDVPTVHGVDILATTARHHRYRNRDDAFHIFMEYKRVLCILHPRAFLFENVKGILSMDGGALFEHVRKEFEDIGYSLQYKILNAVDYGVPQLRERVILVGLLGENAFPYPEPTHGEGLLPYVTLQDALKDLPALSCGEENNMYATPPDNEFLSWVRQGGSDTLTEHKAPNNSAHLRKIMETLKDGQGKDDLPEELRPKSGFKNTYAKLWWEKPATTITRNFACPSSSRCIHPRDSRALTIREGARLQSFPDSYQFYGSDCLKRLEIGNAVPPLLSVALAEQMLKALDSENNTTTDSLH